jgi:ketosteroid isomerase-like protein
LSTDPEAVVRRVNELFNSLPTDAKERAGSEELRQLLDLFHDDVEMVRDQLIFEDTRGKEAFNAGWAEWLGAWQIHRSEIEELHTRGDRVLVLSRDHFVGRDGLETDWSLSAIYEIRDGKVARLQVFSEDRDAAWAAFNSAGPA